MTFMGGPISAMWSIFEWAYILDRTSFALLRRMGYGFMEERAMRFRKKPVVIEAVQFFTSKEPWPDGVEPSVLQRNLPRDRDYWPAGSPVIETLEGTMLVRDGDYIITGIKGERYPCKPDIFEATYDKVGIETTSFSEAFEASGVAEIGAERIRQVQVEGFDSADDDTHTDESLAMAAAHYASAVPLFSIKFETDGEIREEPLPAWPGRWNSDWDKKDDHERTKQLAIAGALCAAEIDRLKRVEKSGSASKKGQSDED